MPSRELREKYARNESERRNLKGRDAINRAIRAELSGGNEALEAIKIAQHHLQRKPYYQSTLDAVQAIVDAMADEIARRYDLKSGRGE